MNAITPQQIQQIVPKTPEDVANDIAFDLDQSSFWHQISERGKAALLANIAFESRGFFNLHCVVARDLDLSCQTWMGRGMNYQANANDFRAITRAFDKNLSGYGARLLIYKQALKVLRNQ